VDVVAHYACYDLHFAFIFSMLMESLYPLATSGSAPEHLPYSGPNLSDRVRGRI
jgi:hypothetical protein